LLADAGFVLEPNLDRPVDKPWRDRGSREFGEVFLRLNSH
jgi:hypothetical protein